MVQLTLHQFHLADEYRGEFACVTLRGNFKGGRSNSIPNKVVGLSGYEKDLLVEKRRSCPFIGSAVAQGKLAVRNNVKNPLASIEDVRN